MVGKLTGARRVLAVGMLAGGTLLVLPAAEADAAIVTDCSTTLDGNPFITSKDQSFDPKVEAPASAPAGAPVTVTIPAGSTVLKPVNVLPISQYQGLFTEFAVDGGTVVSGSIEAATDPTVDGVAYPPNRSTTASSLRIGLDGPVPPGTLVTPTATFKVIPDAAGTPVVFKAKTAGSQVNVGTPAKPSWVVATCPLFDTVLDTMAVTAKAPEKPKVIPGAPRVENDIVTTPAGTPVTIDVLANDKPDPEVGIDATSLELVGAPAHGTAELAGGKVLYTPAAGFVGVEEFKYSLCSEAAPAATTTTLAEPTTTTLEGANLVLEEVPLTTTTTAAPAPEPKCNQATIQVTVLGATPVTPATQAPAPTATVAPTATLPRTGTGSSGLPVLGLGLLAAGLAVAGWARPGARARRA